MSRAVRVLRTLLPRVYIACVIAAGAVLAVTSLDQARFEDPWLFATLLATSSALSTRKIQLPLVNHSATMSISYCVDLAALMMLGPAEAMLVAGASAWTQSVFKTRGRTELHQALFSVACLMITMQTAAQVASRLGGFTGPQTIQGLYKPAVAAAMVYFLANTAIVAGAIALTTGQSILKVWQENFLWSAPGYFVGAGAAVVGVQAAHGSQIWLAPLTLAPIYLTYRSYKIYLGRVEVQQRHLQLVSELHLASVEALARAIDARDQTIDVSRPQVTSHVRRVQSYSVGLARAAGMSESEIQGVKIAALLHDVGKLAVPEHILTKPGQLTRDEFEKIRQHPTIGAEIIRAVPFPYPVAPFIEFHHERWDGSGYPNGLRDVSIPLGARVLSVVDYFDALMADRPYHKAMSEAEAVAMLEMEAGHGLDPALVSTFIRLLPELNGEIAAGERGCSPQSRSVHSDAGKPATGFCRESARIQTQTTVFHNIALAHQDIHALYEIVASMGTKLTVPDTMALIASKVSNLVPASCWALFLLDEDGETLRCRYAAGLDAEVVRQVSVRSGDGMTGWVIRRRASVVNGRPGADIEAAGLAPAGSHLRSALACPLVVSDGLVGVLTAYHADADRYHDDHRKLLERICEKAAAVIKNSIEFERVREEALTDPLTGLPNSRFLGSYVEQEIARAKRHRTNWALLVLDVDDFKEINDRWGHHVGDRALCHVASVLSGVIRPYDLCARYAGDEFVVGLSDCDHEAAALKSLELQDAIRSESFEPIPGVVWPLDISIGAAVCPKDGQSFKSLLKTADRCMYQRKAIKPRSVESFERAVRC